MLRFTGYEEGPIVEFDEDDVTSVESCSPNWVKDEDLLAYLYTRTVGTLAVRYLDLLKVCPKLAKKAKDSMIWKSNQPDPCGGSCT